MKFSCGLLFFDTANEVAVAEAEPKFNPFTGSGRRLDGRPLSYEPQPVAANSNGQSHSVASSSGSEKATQQTQGKLVFGSHVNRATKETTKVSNLFLKVLCANGIRDNKWSRDIM